MGVSSGRSRVADLVFQVFSRPIHPEWFAARQHCRVGQDGWDADLRIIEGGHVINFRSRTVCLTEVLSGPETHTRLPEPGLLFHTPLRRERNVVLRPGDALDYQTCLAVERLDPEVFAHLNDEIILDGRRGRLFHEFATANRLASPPISHIHIDARVRGLTVHTFHTFPAEHAIVRTQSLFEPREVRGPH